VLGKGKFNPNNKVNRGSMAQFMQKLYNSILTKSTQIIIAKPVLKLNPVLSNSSAGSQVVAYTPIEHPFGEDQLKQETVKPLLFLGLLGVYRSEITDITFDNHKPTSCKAPYAGLPIDVGVRKEKEVMACVSKDKTKVLIGEDGGVHANSNSQYLFYGLEQAPTLAGFTNKTHSWEGVTDYTGIFQDYGKGSTKRIITIPDYPDAFGNGNGRDSLFLEYMFSGFGQDSESTELIAIPNFRTSKTHENPTCGFGGQTSNSSASFRYKDREFYSYDDMPSSLFENVGANSSATKVIIPSIFKHWKDNGLYGTYNGFYYNDIMNA
jgi:hypothetical protein